MAIIMHHLEKYNGCNFCHVVLTLVSTTLKVSSRDFSVMKYFHKSGIGIRCFHNVNHCFYSFLKFCSTMLMLCIKMGALFLKHLCSIGNQKY